MAYEHFKPTIWTKHIQGELPKFTVFEGDCDYRFSGEAKRGMTVRILSVGRPQIGDYTGANIGAPENIPDSSMDLKIDQAKYFNFMVDDVDRAQSVEGLMPALLEESTRAMAEQRDIYIAGLVNNSAVTKSASMSIGTPAEAKDAIDGALVTLWKRGVNLKDDVTIYLNPKVYQLMQDSVIQQSTQNEKLLSTGIFGMYSGAKVKMSNNFFSDGTDEHLFIKTSRAIAFCGGIEALDAYRPEGLFSDAIKGLNTYGGKVVRPDELYVIRCH